MSQSYSAETRKILNDFLEALGRNECVDPVLLGELRRMMTVGKLGHRIEISEALAALEERADGLHDRSH